MNEKARSFSVLLYARESVQMGVKMKYHEINRQLASLIEGETNRIANMANAAALLYHSLEQINWAGFYLMEGNELILGPFQGKTACIRIPVGRGVCGCAVQEKSIKCVEDVEQFPGHIACDSASRSEIVIPIRKGDAIIGVLDIDSPVKGRFGREDKEGLLEFVTILEQQI